VGDPGTTGAAEDFGIPRAAVDAVRMITENRARRWSLRKA
jgi:hypothetical protein